MRRNDLILGIVLVVAIIGGGLIASSLKKQQDEIAASRDLVSRMPIAGFQKFMADIIWMRFLYYAGGNQLTAETADKYDQHIRLIIKLDPDFFRAYRDGALMLGPVAPEKALAIIDMAEQHPRIKSRWELPMMGGQIIMRKQWQGHYAGKKIDPAQVAKAQEYFQKAKSLPGHRPTALSSFIRTKALMKGEENGLPREINELIEWKEYWASTRFDYGMDAMMPAGGPAGGAEMMAAGGGYQSLDVDQRIIGQIKKVAKRFVQDPEAKDDLRQKAEELIRNTINDVYPGQHFDAESYIPYDQNSQVRYQGTIDKVDEKAYCLELDSPGKFAVNVLTIRAGKGTAKVSVLIDGKPVAGLQDIEIGQEKSEHPILIPVVVEKEEEKPIDESKRMVPAPDRTPEPPRMVRKPLHANKGKEGSVIELKFSDVSGAADVAYVLSVYRGDYF